MSRVGELPVEVPDGVELKVDGQKVSAKGPKGSLEMTIHELMQVDLQDKVLTVNRPNDSREARSLHGLTRSLIANMVEGVSKGFEKKLELVGTGYRASMSGSKLVLSVGFSHNVEVEAPGGIEVEVPDQRQIVVRGADKQQVGEFAANLRSIRPPEPYKGKGIRYEGEYVRRKEGKTAK